MAAEKSATSQDRIVGFTARLLWGERPTIQVAVEGDLTPNFSARMEQSLKDINLEYESKRESGRMGELSVLELNPGTYNRFRKAKIEKGAPDGQLKDPILALSESEWNAIWEAHCNF